MHAFRIHGGSRLTGRISIDGSKNAALPLMAAALMGDGPVTLRRVPELSDIANMARLLRESVKVRVKTNHPEASEMKFYVQFVTI